MTKTETLSTVEKVLFLKKADIFARANVEELGRIASLTQEVRFATGETIYRAGEAVDAIYIVLEGRAAVQHHRKLIQEVGENDTLGILVALDDAGPALHTVVAKQPIHALKLDVRDFQDVLSLDFELVKAVFRAIARRLRREPEH